MNPYERARNEALAVRLMLLGEATTQEPIKGEELLSKIENGLNLGIDKVPADSHLLGSGDACLRREEQYIYVRDDVSAEHCAELIAHELGHWFLDIDKPALTIAHLADLSRIEGSPALAKVEAYGARERQELQANVFAREFLLPRDVARELFNTGQGARQVAASLGIPLKIVRQQMLDGVLLPVAPVPTAKTPHSPSEDQVNAAHAQERFVNVVAGPGTGKTSTLIERIKYLVNEKGVNPGHILALTFTNKAAFELVERLRASGIENASNIWSGTFHAFGLEFLRKYHDSFGLANNVQVGDKLNSVMLLARALPHIPLKFYKRIEDPYWWLGDVVASIKRLKEELVSPTEYRARLSKLKNVSPELVRQREDVAALYEVHEALLLEAQLVDFVDLVSKPAIAMKEDRAKYSELADKFQHILVDEYQDVTKAMVQLIRVLAGKQNSLWVVGDVRQAIHHWRGASVESLTRFEETFRIQGESNKIIRKYPLAFNRRNSPEILKLVDQCGQLHLLQTKLPLAQTEAKMAATGFKPCLVFAPAKNVSDAVADGVVQLLNAHIPVRPSGQVVLGRWTSHIERVAEALHSRGVPTLYIGELTQRVEIKQMLCLMQLLTERGPRALVGLGALPGLAFNVSDLEVIAKACRSDFSLQRGNWIYFKLEGISISGNAAIAVLRQLVGDHNRFSTPWDFVCDMLLERRIVLPDTPDQSIPACAKRIALWQFVNSLLSGDGDLKSPNLTRYLLRTALRQRINDTYGDRELPPESSSLDAVRLQTVHGSKGLEFDAVHVANVDDQYGQNEPSWTPPDEVKDLVPPEVLDSDAATYQAERAIERQNLLYVAVSRAKHHLLLYCNANWQKSLPPQIQGNQPHCSIKQFSTTPLPQLAKPSGSGSRETAFTFEEFATYVRCPLQHWYRYELKLPREENTDAAARARFAILHAIKECAQFPALNPSTQFHAAWDANRLLPQDQDPGLWNDSIYAFQTGLKQISNAGGTYVEPVGTIKGIRVLLPWMMATKNGPITSHTMLRFMKAGLHDAATLLKPLIAGSDSVRVINVLHVMSNDIEQLSGSKAIASTKAYAGIEDYMNGVQTPKKGHHCSRCAFLTFCPVRP